MKKRVAWNKNKKMTKRYKENVRKGILLWYDKNPEMKEQIKQTVLNKYKNDLTYRVRVSRRTKEAMKYVDRNKLGCWKGKKLSAEHINNIKKSVLKNPGKPWLNKKLTIQHRQNISAGLNKPEILEKLRKNGINVCKKMRKKNTGIEIKLEKIIKSLNIKFKTQVSLPKNKPISIVDFFIPHKNLVIYADGDYWHNLLNYKIRDKKQNKILKQNGYKVLRFWEHEINNTPEKCLNIIKKYIKSNV